MPTTSISGSSESKLDNNCRITAESSTINTRTGPLSCASFESLKQLDFARGLVVSRSRFRVGALFAIDSETFAAAKQVGARPVRSIG